MSPSGSVLATSTDTTSGSSVTAGSGLSDTSGAPGRPLTTSSTEAEVAWPSRSVASTVISWVPRPSDERVKAALPEASGAVVSSSPSRSEVHTTARSGGASSPSVMVAAKSTGSPALTTSPSVGAVSSTSGGEPMV